MVLKYKELPLYPDPDYYYPISLQGSVYRIRFYFNERVRKWAFDVSYSGGEPIVLGTSLVRGFPMFLDYNISGLDGYFLLREIGKDINNTISNDYEIWKYYKLYYIWEE